MKDLVKVYCDSGLNESCYVIEGCKPVVKPHEGKLTVNQAEYIAVIRALNDCWHHGMRGFQILTDSQLLVRQVNARANKNYESPYQTQNKRLYTLGTLLLSLLGDCQAELHHVPREKNPAGIELERRKKKKRVIS